MEIVDGLIVKADEYGVTVFIPQKQVDVRRLCLQKAQAVQVGIPDGRTITPEQKTPLRQEKLRLQKKSKLTLVVYAVIRLIVIGVLIRSAFNGQIESVYTCLLTLVLLLLPSILERKLGVRLPAGLEITVVVFIFAAEILGEIACFYVTVPFWDKALHTTSGFIYAAVGYSMADVLNRHKKVSFELSPLFLALVAFCFSMTIGALWEIFEFSVDNLFHKDMQKDTVIQQITSVALDPTNRNIPITISNIQDVVVNGESLGLGGYLDIGLYDTMGDLIVNLIGAVVFSVIGYFHQKHRKKSVVTQLFVPQVDEKEEDVQHE